MAYLYDDASPEEMDELYEYLDTTDDVNSYLNMYMSTVTLLNEKEEWEVYMSVPENEKTFEEFVILADRMTQEKCNLTDDGVVVNEKTAKMLDVQLVEDAGGHV